MEEKIDYVSQKYPDEELRTIDWYHNKLNSRYAEIDRLLEVITTQDKEIEHKKKLVKELTNKISLIPTSNNNDAYNQQDQKVKDKTKERLEKLVQKAEDDVVYRRIKNNCSRELEAEGLSKFVSTRDYPKDEASTKFYEKIDEDQDKENSRTRNAKLTPQKTVAYFITLRPEEGLFSPVELISAFKSAFHLKTRSKPLEAVEWCVFVIEQVGVTEKDMGKGPHIHCLLKLQKKDAEGKTIQTAQPAKMVPFIKDKFQRFITKTPEALDIVAVSEKSIPNKIAYMAGDKDPEKMPAVEMDDIWREQNKMDPFYGSSNWQEIVDQYLPPQ